MKQLRMVRQMMIGAAAASMLMTSAPAWAEQAAADGTGGSTGLPATTTAAPAAQPAAPATVRTKFPDVSSTHWALQHITKLAIEGIVEGNEYGEYRPEDSVQQQDVLIMVIRMMGLEADAKANTATVKLPFDVREDAKPYVVEAISKGLITIKEETDANAQSKTAWGSRPATREWVAKIMVRMLGKQADAELLASNPTAFKDNSQISPWAIGYINEAVSLGLVQGFEDGSFQPQGSVTRAQMATFLSRSEKQAATKSPRYATGYVSSLGDGKLVLQDLDGNTTTYTITSDTVFYGKKEGERIPSNAIQQTYEVSVLQVGGTVYYVEVTNDQLQMDVYSGSVYLVDTVNLRLYLQTGGNIQFYDLAPDVAVTDANGQGSSLSALVKNSIVEVRKNRLVKSNKYTQIIIKQVPVNKTSEGTIQGINQDTKEFQVLDKTSGNIETYTLNDPVSVRLPGNTPADLSSLHVGDTVTYTVSNNLVTAITVTKQIDIGTTVQGTIIGSVSAENGVINIRLADGRPMAYDLSDTVRVNIEGKTSAGLNDLANGDAVTLDLLNNKVQTINVTSSTIQNLVFATIISYEPTSRVLTVKDNSGQLHAYYMTDQTAVLMYGANYTLANFMANFTSGKRVDIQATKDSTISSISLSTQLSGVITALNPTARQITVKTGSQNVSFTMAFTPTIELYGNPSATLSDLKVGDTVTLDVNPSQQDVILKITATKTQLYKVVLSDANLRQLTLQDLSGTNIVLTLDASAEIVAAGKSAPGFSDILTDEYVKLTFKGNTVTKAEVVTPVRGKVLAVDAAAGTLTVQDFAGQTQLISLGANATVTGSGNVPLTLAAVKVGDRVQVMKDADDKVNVKVATAVQRTFVSYNGGTNQLSFSSPSGSDTYTMYQRAYLHQGTQTLSITGFAANDSVTVYAIDGRVIEMEKQ
jgi:Cu/Ag efflux protein CusF